MQKVKFKSGWMMCGNCGHKLGRAFGEMIDDAVPVMKIEMKCHSCKEINVLSCYCIKNEKEVSNA